MQELTPRQIVEELDRHIIGQADAKRAVAVAIRNRWRRKQLDADMAREVYPKNIVMSGPTGVGKTEIARRLASLTGAPLVKVEASKFTEVGYHGRDVESMIRDLLDQAISMVRREQAQTVAQAAQKAATDRLVGLLLPGGGSPGSPGAGSRADSGSAGASGGAGVSEGEPAAIVGSATPPEAAEERREQVRRRLREQLEAGALDDREVELDVTHKPAVSAMFANMGIDQMGPDMANMFEQIMPAQTQRRRTTVAEARRILTEQETDKRLDPDKITAEAIERTQDSGIVFLDEIDKIASPAGDGQGRGPDVSRQGVQRDLLPIVEGSTVTTRHGTVRTDHILFIAAGAFHSSSMTDLMPELQGRFPIRVELSPLGRDEFVRILTEPKGALTHQQKALLAVEGIAVRFEDGAIGAIADLAAQANATLENIGARRLMTIVEKVFEQLNFEAPDRVAAGDSTFVVTEAFVREQVAPIIKDQDLSRFVL